MKKNLMAMCLLLLSVGSFAQIKYLIPGDEIKDFKFDKMVNYKYPSANLSDFKGELLILDFWATWCSPCVASLPKLDSLEKQFGGRLKILRVTKEKEKTVFDFLDRMKKNTGLKLSSVVEDSILNLSFQFTTMPFYVWIKNNKVIAMSRTKEVTFDNINAVLNNKSLPFKQAEEFVKIKVPIADPLFLVGNPIYSKTSMEIQKLDVNKVLGQSIATKYLEQYGGLRSWNPTRYTAINTIPSVLYRDLYSFYKLNRITMMYQSEARFKIEIADTATLHAFSSQHLDINSDIYQQWFKQHAVCYEIVFPKDMANDHVKKFNYMKNDLDKYFGSQYGITSVLEKRLLKSKILVQTSGIVKSKSSGGKAEEKYDKYHFQLVNLPISRLIQRMEVYFFQMSDVPFINEVKDSGNVDIELNCNMNDINAINKELKKYGYQFIDGDRMGDVLVIRKSK